MSQLKFSQYDATSKSAIVYTSNDTHAYFRITQMSLHKFIIYVSFFDGVKIKKANEYYGLYLESVCSELDAIASCETFLRMLQLAHNNPPHASN